LPPTKVECSDYAPWWNNEADNTGITNPKGCAHDLPITSPNIALSVNSVTPKESITTMSLSSVENTYLPVKLAENFPNLQYIQSTDTKLDKLFKANFEGLTKLKKIRFDRCKISKLDTEVFQPLTGLQHLGLSRYHHGF
jgi:hypothetical protein